MGASISDIRLLLKIKKLARCSDPRRVFITGGTGYIGSHLIPALLERGHHVRALVRPGSKGHVPAGCEVISGNALDANSYRLLVRPANTFIHLVGVARPSPSKAQEFRAVDLVSAQQAIAAAADLALEHFVYLSVAHPAPVMKEYTTVRAECEAMIHERALSATILRPWYVLGPGHQWPYVLLPIYKILELLPFTRAAARRLGLVTLEEMILALVYAVESPPPFDTADTSNTGSQRPQIRVMNVPDIRSARTRIGALAAEVRAS